MSKGLLLLLIGVGLLYGCGGSNVPSEPLQDAKIGSVKECEADFACFIDASKSCEASVLSRTFELDVFGALVKTTESYALHGLANEKCSLTLTTKNDVSDVKITQECLFPTDMLASVLTKRKNHAIADAEWSPYCSDAVTSFEEPVETSSKQPKLGPIVGQIDIVNKIPDKTMDRVKRDDILGLNEFRQGSILQNGYVGGRKIELSMSSATSGGVRYSSFITLAEFDSNQNAQTYFDAVIEDAVNGHVKLLVTPDQQASEASKSTCQSTEDFKSLVWNGEKIMQLRYNIFCHKNNFYFTVTSVDDVSIEDAKGKGISILQAIDEAFRQHQNVALELGVSHLNIWSTMPSDLKIVDDDLDFLQNYIAGDGYGYVMGRTIGTMRQYQTKFGPAYEADSNIYILEFDSHDNAQKHYDSVSFENRKNYVPPVEDVQLSETVRAICKSASRSVPSSFNDQTYWNYDAFCHKGKYYFDYGPQSEESLEEAKNNGIGILMAVSKAIDEAN